MIRILVLLMATWSAAEGAVYYVDRAGGNDSRDGRTAATAWTTLGRLARAGIVPGDYILLKRGQVWNEAFVVSFSGTAEAPVTIGAYGDGDRPVIDGTQVGLPRSGALLDITGRENLVVSGLEIRNSPRSALIASESSALTLRDLMVSASRENGILIYNCGGVAIERVEVFGNSLDLSDSYDGIRIDSNREVAGFRISASNVHHNLGGADWRSANGIFIGHTGRTAPTIRNVVIADNELWKNGNPDQNQAGRGISGTFRGDVTIAGNYVHHNASAGIYVGDVGLEVEIVISRNTFYNNALRQFGGFTDTRARAEMNLLIVDDPEITAMGVEVGGMGGWELRQNTFLYLTDTDDRFRAFIGLNNPEQEKVMKSDFNFFFSAGPRRWKRADESVLTFQQWQQAGFDVNSRNPR